jgi:hypothetical protein
MYQSNKSMYLKSNFIPKGAKQAKQTVVVEVEVAAEAFQMKVQVILAVVLFAANKNQYINLPEVQQALHANRTHLKYHWSMCSE